MANNSTVRFLRQIADLPDIPAWQALVGEHPALQFAFLDALEKTGACTATSGWQPMHAIIEENGMLMAAMPLYLKSHSYGEYVFDWSWAEAYQQHGEQYYPKLLAALPFSPLPGTRIAAVNMEYKTRLITGTLEELQLRGLSSMHVLFANNDEIALLEKQHFLRRDAVQFHWQNHNYLNFEEFLGKLNRDKRKKIRQDRKRTAASNLQYEWYDGYQAQKKHWQFFYGCYEQTYFEHRSSPYLSEAFFSSIGQNMPDNVLLVIASHQGEPVASAFFLKDSQTLYGRYWGSKVSIDCLHFELCYYSAIDYCIVNKLQHFEGGVQGEHKMARGLTPVQTSSAHYIAEPRFATAIERFLQREREHIGYYLKHLDERTPYKELNFTVDAPTAAFDTKR